MACMHAADIGGLCSDRGWTRSRLILELRRAARIRDMELPSDDSLRRMIREWTNGRRGLSPFYADLLSAAFKIPFIPGRQGEPEDAGAPAEDERIELAKRLNAATIVDKSLIDLLENQTQSLRLLDRRLGAGNLLTQSEAHVNQVVELLKFTLPGGQRAMLGAAAAEAAALAGWQALDQGNLTKAWDFHETAKIAARESGDPTFLAHVATQQAYALLDAERTEDAVLLMQHARFEAGTRVPPLLQSWLLAAEAEAHAACGNEQSSREAMEAASRILPADGVAEELPFLALDTVHLARWRGHCLARLGSTEAVEDLSGALASMDPSFTRAIAGLRCDLALAHSVRGDHTAARKIAQEAADLATRTSSERQRRRITELLTSGS